MDFQSGGPDQPGPPRYVILNSDHTSPSTSAIRPPPHRRNLPRYHSNTHSDSDSDSNSFSFLCFFCCLLFLILLVMVSIMIYIYIIVNPQAPKLTFDHISISNLAFGSDRKLHTRLLFDVRFENPNTGVEINYSGGTVTVGYKKVTLCTGHLPSFYQAHRNTTVIKLELEGKVGYDNEMKQAIMGSNKGVVPLEVHARVPVAVALMEMTIANLTTAINCSIIVDNLLPNKKIGIKSKHCELGVN